MDLLNRIGNNNTVIPIYLAGLNTFPLEKYLYKFKQNNLFSFNIFI